MSRDTYGLDYTCGDCGRDDHTSLSAMMHCPCWKIDRHGYEKEAA